MLVDKKSNGASQNIANIHTKTASQIQRKKCRWTNGPPSNYAITVRVKMTGRYMIKRRSDCFHQNIWQQYSAGVSKHQSHKKVTVLYWNGSVFSVCPIIIWYQIPEDIDFNEIRYRSTVVYFYLSEIFLFTFLQKDILIQILTQTFAWHFHVNSSIRYSLINCWTDLCVTIELPQYWTFTNKLLHFKMNSFNVACFTTRTLYATPKAICGIIYSSAKTPNTIKLIVLVRHYIYVRPTKDWFAKWCVFFFTIKFWSLFINWLTKVFSDYWKYKLLYARSLIPLKLLFLNFYIFFVIYVSRYILLISIFKVVLSKQIAF